ncbi:hypothetical protein J6590_080528 [Homalodisca vitripennis]|nr:hypothetical protein J6590_080528 [Homalodisca vitripennis]
MDQDIFISVPECHLSLECLEFLSNDHVVPILHKGFRHFGRKIALQLSRATVTLPYLQLGKDIEGREVCDIIAVVSCHALRETLSETVSQSDHVTCTLQLINN